MPIVDLEHASYSFGEYWALKNVSFSLDAGEFMFLTGPSGAGKTTLLRVLYGGLPLERGSGMVAGFSLKNLSPAKLPLLRREVGVVFQDFRVLASRTVFENVAIALEVRGMAGPLIERRVRAVLRGLNLETKSQARCDALSGGEQQRVAIARAIVVNPKVLLADEPTGNLDPRLSFRIMELFYHFNQHGTTVILATHNPELIACLPHARVLALEHGQIVEDEQAAENQDDRAPAPYEQDASLQEEGFSEHFPHYADDADQDSAPETETEQDR